MIVGICDDNETHLNLLKEELINFGKKNQVILEINAFISGEQLMFEMEDHKEPLDLIYMDIRMPGMNGVEIAHRLRRNGLAEEIISQANLYILERYTWVVTKDPVQGVYLGDVMEAYQRSMRSKRTETGVAIIYMNRKEPDHSYLLFRVTIEYVEEPETTTPEPETTTQQHTTLETSTTTNKEITTKEKITTTAKPKPKPTPPIIEPSTQEPTAPWVKPDIQEPTTVQETTTQKETTQQITSEKDTSVEETAGQTTEKVLQKQPEEKDKVKKKRKANPLIVTALYSGSGVITSVFLFSIAADLRILRWYQKKKKELKRHE